MFQAEPDPVKRIYYAMIRQLDDNIGKLLATIDELELTKRTLVIFVSDNGGATYTQTTDNGSLRGGKISDFEGGLRVPLFIKWPEVLPSGAQVHHPVIAMDIFSTIASAAKLPVPGDRLIDGADLVNYSFQDSVAPHPFLFWQRGQSKAIRSQRWKALWNEDSGDTLLFDLSNDPGEEHDLFGRFPDTAIWLTEVHRVWSESLPAPSWPPIVRFSEDFNGRKVYFDN
jgi:arylsulfatase A-like enzyme